jgi:flagellar hook-associated protein FlgK
LETMISSVLNEGARAVQTSQREMVKSANEIAHASIRSDVTATEASGAEAAVIAPVSEAPREERSGSITEPLIEMRRAETIFNAGAKLIGVADQTLGSLLDIKS